MAILSATPGSVLWLRTGNEGANQRLRAAAAQSGVAPERLIFAPGVSGHANHIARMGVADLFPRHVSLWRARDGDGRAHRGLAGPHGARERVSPRVSAPAWWRRPACPISFAADRTSTSAAPSHFAHDRHELAAIKAALQRQHATCTLRDAPAFARRLEELFWQMQGEAERGETPVPDLRNLDLYYEIGANFVLANVEFVDDHAYRRRYLEKLAEWNDYAPIARDGRLWTEPQG